MNKPLLHFHPPSPSQASDVAPAVVLRGVAKSFQARHGAPAVHAVKDIDLTVPAGTILGVIGRSGAGKSTLIRLMNGLERPTAGQVLVGGTDLTGLPDHQLRKVRRSIGMVCQHFNLLASRTAFANVALPLEIAGHSRNVIRARVDSLLERVGLADQRDRFPAQLSGGQKQRVGIARAIATSPDVLLCDEATSALDPETTRSILDLLSSINRELRLTIVMITHEMSVIRATAHSVAVMDAGRIVEQGDVFDVFTRPRHVATRSLLSAEAVHAVPDTLHLRPLAEAPPGSRVIMRVIFQGPQASEPILSRLTRELSVDIGIVAGAISVIGERPFGSLLIGFEAESALVERIAAFLAERGFGTQVLGYVA